MKKVLACLCTLLLLTGCTSGVAETTTTTEAPATTESTLFIEDVLANETYKSVGAVAKEEGATTGYILDASGKPSDEDIQLMLDFASKAVASGGENDFYFVVVEDVEEQNRLIGTSKGVYTGEGTITVLCFSERLVDTPNQNYEDGAEYIYQNDRGYYDAGIATGYLNLAAINLGYGTHMFMGLPTSAGTLGEKSVDYDKYLKDAEGNFLTYENGDSTSSRFGTHSTENLKIVCAIVIGTVDPEMNIDGFTGATTRSTYPANYTIWSGYNPITYDFNTKEDGSYDVAIEGTDGQFQITVEVQGGAITGITTTPESLETMRMSEEEFNQLTSEIIDSQSLEVDTISGATLTSNDILASLNELFKKN